MTRISDEFENGCNQTFFLRRWWFDVSDVLVFYAFINLVNGAIKSTHHYSGSEVTHHYSASDATLAACQVPCHLQNRHYRASDSPPPMPVVPGRPCRVCFGRPGCTSTSLLHGPTAVVRRSRTQFGRQAFSVAGPDIWNSLPAAIRTIDSHSAFRRALGTHLLRSAFDITSLFTVC